MAYDCTDNITNDNHKERRNDVESQPNKEVFKSRFHNVQCLFKSLFLAFRRTSGTKNYMKKKTTFCDLAAML